MQFIISYNIKNATKYHTSNSLYIIYVNRTEWWAYFSRKLLILIELFWLSPGLLQAACMRNCKKRRKWLRLGPIVCSPSSKHFAQTLNRHQTIWNTMQTPRTITHVKICRNQTDDKCNDNYFKHCWKDFLSRFFHPGADLPLSKFWQLILRRS